MIFSTLRMSIFAWILDNSTFLPTAEACKPLNGSCSTNLNQKNTTSIQLLLPTPNSNNTNLHTNTKWQPWQSLAWGGCLRGRVLPRKACNIGSLSGSLLLDSLRYVGYVLYEKAFQQFRVFSTFIKFSCKMKWFLWRKHHKWKLNKCYAFESIFAKNNDTNNVNRKQQIISF